MAYAPPLRQMYLRRNHLWGIASDVSGRAHWAELPAAKANNGELQSLTSSELPGSYHLPPREPAALISLQISQALVRLWPSS